MLADRMADSVFKCLPAVVQPLPGAKEVHKHRIIGAGRDLRNPFVPPSHVTRKDVQEVGERTCRGWRGLEGGATRLVRDPARPVSLTLMPVRFSSSCLVMEGNQEAH